MTDFGYDTSCIESLRAGRYVSGQRLVGEAVYRRLTTRTGELITDPDYGFHLGNYLGATVSPVEIARLPGLIKQEILKDSRVVAADIDVTQTGSSYDLTWTIDIRVATDLGPFDLVIGVEDASATLLEISAS